MAGEKGAAIDELYLFDFESKPLVDSLTIGCVDPFHFVKVPVETFRQYCLVPNWKRALKFLKFQAPKEAANVNHWTQRFLNNRKRRMTIIPYY